MSLLHVAIGLVNMHDSPNIKDSASSHDIVRVYMFLSLTDMSYINTKQKSLHTF